MEERIMGDIKKLLLIIIMLLLWSEVKTFVFPEAVATNAQSVRIVAVGNTSTYNGVLPVRIK